MICFVYFNKRNLLHVVENHIYKFYQSPIDLEDRESPFWRAHKHAQQRYPKQKVVSKKNSRKVSCSVMQTLLAAYITKSIDAFRVRTTLRTSSFFKNRNDRQPLLTVTNKIPFCYSSFLDFMCNNIRHLVPEALDACCETNVD